MIRNRRFLQGLLVVLFSLLWVQPSGAQQQGALTISAETYYDKTLAAILGQIGGFLSGYEFVTNEPMPDEWFRLTYGPYSGDSPYFAVTDFPGYDRLFEDGRVGGDDDYHVDFFIQLILERYGPDASFWDIREAWTQHQVNDWGGSDIAMQLMNEGMLPPQVGTAEYNRFYWVSEPYIETETVGLVAPGMPQTARQLTSRFASVVGEFDSLIWGEFWGTMYAIAYFETDARAALEQAAAVLPADSYPYFIYQTMLRLHETYPDDWRMAQREIQQYSRPVYRLDNPLVIADMNNAMGIMAILYGENDYMRTAQIASLSGFDADCTAAAALGLMGIIHGMDGTPEEILTRIYADGEGVYVNDLVTGYPPFIGYDYPEEQRWTDLAALYQRNAEAQILAQGGSVENGVYTIVPETLTPDQVVLIPNYDFEEGTLAGWSADSTGEDVQIVAEANTRLESGSNMAHSGSYKGAILTDGGEGWLYVTLDDLEVGATYRISAYVQADEAARLFVRQGSELLWAGVSHTIGLPEREWARREIEFTATDDGAAQIGLYVPTDIATRAGIDNLFVRRVEPSERVRYEAENAELTGVTALTAYVTDFAERDDAIDFTVNAPEAGEYWLYVYYANGDGRAGRVRITVNEQSEAVVLFAPTGSYDVFSRSRVVIPVVLDSGTNHIRFDRRRSGELLQLDVIELELFQPRENP